MGRIVIEMYEMNRAELQGRTRKKNRRNRAEDPRSGAVSGTPCMIQ